LKARLLLAAGVLVACGAFGCAGPVARDAARFEPDRALAAGALDGFAEALRAGSPERLGEVLLPALTNAETAALEVRLEQASWLSRYEGYAPDVAAALSRVGPRAWQRGRVLLRIPATNARGLKLKDRAELIRAQDRWWLADFELRQPVEGDRIRPPQTDLDELRRQASRIMDALRQGHTSYVYSSLPDQAVSRYRVPRDSFLRGLFWASGPVWVFDDLEIVSKLDFISWPKPSGPLDLAYVAPGTVAVCYAIPYSWAPADPEKPDMLHVRLVFVKQPEGWSFFRILFSGKAIPGS